MNIFPINILLLVVVVVIVVIIVIAVSCDPWRMGGRRVQVKVEFIALAPHRRRSRGNNFLVSLNDSRKEGKGKEGEERHRNRVYTSECAAKNGRGSLR